MTAASNRRRSLRALPRSCLVLNLVPALLQLELLHKDQPTDPSILEHEHLWKADIAADLASFLANNPGRRADAGAAKEPTTPGDGAPSEQDRDARFAAPDFHTISGPARRAGENESDRHRCMHWGIVILR